jgi:hypothetical protein
LTLALSLFLLPFCVRDSDRCARRSLFSARRKNRGEVILRPSDSTAKCCSPRSTPITGSVPGSAPGPAWMTNEAKYRPAQSLITVTLDGADGSGRDHRTGTSPIFGNRSFPFGSTRNRALTVNRIACRVSLRDRNRGGRTAGPARWPLERREEIPVGRVQVSQGLLQDDRRDVAQPGPPRGSLRRSQPGGQLHVGHVRQPGLVRLLPGAQPVVVHHPDAAERLPQRDPVPRLRVQAVVIPELHTLTIPGCIAGHWDRHAGKATF